jgi:hypothetical protein
MKIRIPKTVRYELLARLEECGAYAEGDDRFPLYSKISEANYKNAIIDLDQNEIEELLWHCVTMIEIANIDYDGEDKQLNREARGAKTLIKLLKVGA